MISQAHPQAFKVFRAAKEDAWFVEAGVVACLNADAGLSLFPAMPQSMLTLRLDAMTGDVHTDLAPSFAVAFHSMSTAPTAFVHTRPIIAVGVLLSPAAAASLLRYSGLVTVDQVFDWGTIAGASEVERLANEVSFARTDGERIGALIDSVRRALSKERRELHETHLQLCDALGRYGAGACEFLGLGPRQLERHCQRVLGVSPKTFQRLVRFRRALGQAMTANALSLADVAMDGGYYDQSHLARDARALAGASVSSLLAQVNPASPWWSLAAGRELVLPSRHQR